MADNGTGATGATEGGEKAAAVMAAAVVEGVEGAEEVARRATDYCRAGRRAASGEQPRPREVGRGGAELLFTSY